jgi:hypothetical protein
MPTIQEQPGDLQYGIQLISGTTYVGYNAALVAATTLSAANANGPVAVMQCKFQASSNGPTGAQEIDLPGNGVPLYFIALTSGLTTYIPQGTAINAAYILSGLNAKAFVYVGQVVNLVTAP